jgi:hypothetical protein
MGYLSTISHRIAKQQRESDRIFKSPSECNESATMSRRWQILYANLGTIGVLKTVFMLVGLMVLSVMGYVFATSLACTYTAACGIGLGVVFRRMLVPLRDHYSVILRVGLTIYGPERIKRYSSAMDAR